MYGLKTNMPTLDGGLMESDIEPLDHWAMAPPMPATPWRLEQEPLMVALRTCRRKGHKMDFSGDFGADLGQVISIPSGKLT